MVGGKGEVSKPTKGQILGVNVKTGTKMTGGGRRTANGWKTFSMVRKNTRQRGNRGAKCWGTKEPILSQKGAILGGGAGCEVTEKKRKDKWSVGQ